MNYTSQFSDSIQDIKDFFVYTIWRNGIYEFIYNIKHAILNCWNFRKQLWQFRQYDYEFAVLMFSRSLELLKESIKNGHEERRSANKKIQRIDELIELLAKDVDDDCVNVYTECSKGNITKDERDIEIDRIRHEHYSKIFNIIEGQSNIKLAKEVNNKLKDHPNKDDHEVWYNTWVDKFDGSGIEGWWD